MSNARDLSDIRLPLSVSQGGNGHGGILPILDPAVNWDTLITPGEYYIRNPTGVSAPNGASSFTVRVLNTPDGLKQIATRRGSGYAFSRAVVSGSWTTWTSTYDQTNIVGTVSQVSNIPTGAIIERGSNANGDFIKYADGTLICWRNQTAPVAMTSAYGAVFNGTSFGSVDYPHPFIAVPNVNQHLAGATGVIWGASNGVSSATQWNGMFPLGAVSQASITVTIYRFAIGRWY